MIKKRRNSFIYLILSIIIMINVVIGCVYANNSSIDDLLSAEAYSLLR